MSAKKILAGLLLALVGTVYFGPVLCQAAGQGTDSFAISVVPPLFQLALNPGETFNSTVKVVNSNKYPITLYATVMNFTTEGEEGMSKLVPNTVQQGTDDNSLAQWVDITKDPISLQPDQAQEIPFSVSVPKNGPPGGHYAAILIGNRAAAGKPDEPSISVSSFVSTLLFVRVAGNVSESGSVREFKAQQMFNQQPDVNFTLRFENSGNVHLQPQGFITIYNMWGKKRGEIPINQKTAFGFVLPQTIRKFNFNWRGDNGFFDIGQYKAVATLAFGQEAKQNISAISTFWVIPVKPVLGLLGGIIIFVFLITWFIKLYIRRTLRNEAASFLPQSHLAERTVDRPAGEFKRGERGRGKNGYLIWFALGILVLGIVGGIIYFKQVLSNESQYEVTIQKNDGTTQVLNQDGQ